MSAALALTDAGLSASDDGGGSHSHGAEAAHVAIDVAPTGAVVLRGDGTGLLPLFWGLAEGQLVVSTHLASLVTLGLAPTADEQALVEYLALLHPLGERTQLRDARVLPAGGTVQWQVGGQVRTSAAPLFRPRAAASDDDALAAFGEAWSAVVGDVLERRTGERLLQGLSGGLDSRAFAVTAADLGARPLAYTYGDGRNREVVAAAQVAQTLGLPHVTVPVTSDRVLGRPLPAAHDLDGAHSPSEMYELWFTELLRGIGDTVVNGLAGGTLWGDDKALGLVDHAAALRQVSAKYAVALQGALPLLRPDLRSEASGLLTQALSSSFASAEGRGRADAVIYWRMVNRQQRWGAMLVNGLRRAGLGVELPFLDARSLAITAALTPEQRRNGRLYLRAHRTLFAQTAHLARADDGNAPAQLDHVYWSGDRSYARQLADLGRRHPVSAVRRAARRGSGDLAAALARHTPLVRPAWSSASRGSVFPAGVWVHTRPEYRVALASLLEAGSAGHPGLSSGAMTSAAEALRSGRPVGDPLVLGRAAAAGVWAADYRSRAAARQSS